MGSVRKDIESEKEAALTMAQGDMYPESGMLRQRLEWFEDLKFGVIFHYGLYAEAGIVESWQLSEKDEWAREKNPYRKDIKQLQLDYWQLITKFNPTNFDARKWAKVCKEAGINYCIFTTKHHDGFSLFNTQESEFKIGGKLSPFKRDIAAEVFTAFRDAGLAVGAYYSKADWYSPFYWLDDGQPKGRNASYDPQSHPEIWQRYVAFVHRQIQEITHNYGKLDLLWLDAGWCGSGKENLTMDKLAEIARQKQEDLIIVDRMMGGRHENYVTPERKIPDFAEIPTRTWESNIPIGEDWGYVPTDSFKSSKELIEILVEVVSKGGNLLLGVGPTPTGEITAEEQKILAEMGEWLAIYGEGIYETRAQPKKSDNHWWFTYSKDYKKIYAFNTQRLASKKIYLQELEATENREVTDLATGKQLTIRNCDKGDYISLDEIIIPTSGVFGLCIFTHQ